MNVLIQATISDTATRTAYPPKSHSLWSVTDTAKIDAKGSSSQSVFHVSREVHGIVCETALRTQSAH